MMYLSSAIRSNPVLNTPDEINKLRQELHRKDIELSQLQASGRWADWSSRIVFSYAGASLLCSS
jgi:hypothetical protein